MHELQANSWNHLMLLKAERTRHLRTHSAQKIEKLKSTIVFHLFILMDKGYRLAIFQKSQNL